MHAAAILIAATLSSHPDLAGIARWLEQTAIATAQGTSWPEDAMRPDVSEIDTGTGSAGVLVFWIAMHRADPEGGFLEQIRRTADHLAANMRSTIEPRAPFEWTTGLYGPIAGPAYALNEAYRETRDEKHRLAALRLVDLLHATATRTAQTAAWNTNHDVLTGAAGTGLFLLYAAREMGRADSLQLAKEVGTKLLRVGIPLPNGRMTWKGSYEARFNLPNFSHGTAGIAYFLASLHEQTKDRPFLDGAVAGANWLRDVADRTEGGFRLYYGWPEAGWSRPYDIGWAHGQAGTARLFYKLWLITGERDWRDLVHAGARSLRSSGLPRSPKAEYGAKFELDQRFGIAGVVRFFSDLAAVMDDKAQLEFADTLAQEIRSAATREHGTVRWRRPRHVFMSEPGKDGEFTGYFYGAAGYGLALLGVELAKRGEAFPLRLPDDPFGEKRR